MQIIENITEFHITEKTAIAIGKFDGVHLGHKKLLKVLLEAKKQGLATAIFTFSPSPYVYFSKGECKELSTLEEKRELFAALGVDYLVEYPFNEASKNISPEDYVKEFLIEKMNGAFLVAGADITFGRAGKGDQALLKELAYANGLEVCIVEKETWQGQDISSTLVREKISQGAMEDATALLGEPYRIRQIVRKGKQLGRTLSMPTINLYPDGQKLLPPFGVYASYVHVDGKRYTGITNIGMRPTVDDGNAITAETYIYDFDDEIYGESVLVELLHFSRPEQKFEDIYALREAVRKDMEEGRRYFQHVH